MCKCIRRAFSLSLLLISVLICLNSCKTPSIIATRAIQAGDEYNNQQKYDEAIVQYELYIETAPKLGIYRNPSMEADVYRKLSYAYSTKGLYNTSISKLNSALAIDSTIPANSLEVIEDYRKIGMIHGLLGNYKAAVEFLNISLALNRGMEKSLKDVKRLSLADTYMSLSQINYTIGNFAKAKEYTEQALDIYKKASGEYIGPIEAYLLMGKIYIETQDLNKGLELVTKSQEIAEEHDLNTARHDLVLSKTYLLKADYENALKFALGALKKAEESKIISQIIWMNIKVGDIYQKIGDIKKAYDYYYKAEEIKENISDETSAMLPSIKMRLGDVKGAFDLFENSGSKTGVAVASLKLANLKSTEHKFDEAKRYFRKSAFLFSKIGSDEGLAVANLGLAGELINTDSIKSASTILMTVKKLSNHPENEWKRFYETGRIFEAEGKIDSAFVSYVKAVKIIESIRGKLTIEEFRSFYSNDKQFVYNKLIMLLLGSNDQSKFPGLKNKPATEAFYYSERAKAKSFLDMLGNSKIKTKNAADSTLINKEFLLRNRIKNLTLEIQKSEMGYYDREALQSNLRVLRKEWDDVVQQIKLQNKDYNSIISVEPEKIEKIISVLDKNQSLIQYSIGDDHLAVWLINSKGLNAFVQDIKSDELLNLVKDTRKLINPYGNEKAFENLNVLYGILIKPFEKFIKNSSSLVIVPHNSLHFLPFHALLDDKNKYLAEKYNISYSPSASVLVHCKSMHKASGNNFLGIALGDLSLGGFNGLPGTEHEIKQIIGLYNKPTTSFKDKATESFLKQESDKYNILHIATHGILNERMPMYSYLLLSPDDQNDGQLTVNEIFDMNLNSKLVTLSACETGLGKLSQGDELIGLSRAFIYAGSPAVIVSLWPVDDVSTAFIMTKLYQYYSSGYSLSESLNFAQRSLFEKDVELSVTRGRSLTSVNWNKEIINKINAGSDQMKRNPFFWAPFIIIGYPGN